MPGPTIVTLTTDFGTRDTYVGQMKGAILRVCREVLPVDLCHEVPPQDVSAGAYLLETGYSTFPAGTIHLAVVDPGVGTPRHALAVRTARYRFVAPDNGLLQRVLQREGEHEAWTLPPTAEPSATFEGRDRFAPAAARLAAGAEPADLGGRPVEPQPLPGALPRPRRSGELELPVVWIDGFGNVVLDMRLEGAPKGLRVETPGGTVASFHRTYGEAPPGRPFALVNSAGYLELAVPCARADAALGLGRGDRVLAHLAD